MGDVSLLVSTLGMMLGCNMVHCGTEFRQLGRGNYLTSTRAIQMSRRWGLGSSSHLPPSYPLLGRGQTTATSELLHPGKCPDKSLETTVRNKCMSPCSMAGSWPGKELDLECKLESALHADFYAKSHGVQSSHCSSTWVN